MDKKTVLIIDDDKFLLDMYSIKFKKAGFEVFAMPRAEEALKKLKENFVPDIIILDMVMPGMDGLHFLEAMRKESLAKSSAVVILSNQGQQSDIDKAKELGFDGYIVKATTIPSEVVEQVVAIREKKK